jgi:hypothetical protein
MPLFSFVWEYNNQPIQVLAADIAALSVNNPDYIPVSTGNNFIDSPLKVELVAGQPILTSYRNGLWDGIRIGPAKYEFGALQVGAGAGNVTRVKVDDLGAQATFTASYPNFVQFGVSAVSQAILADGIDTTTAGTSAGKYLRVRIGNTDYKLELLADV